MTSQSMIEFKVHSNNKGVFAPPFLPDQCKIASYTSVPPLGILCTRQANTWSLSYGFWGMHGMLWG